MTATPATDLPFETLISARAQGIDVSGIRRVFELGAQLENPINLSIGQPDFEVPAPIRAAACAAIEGGSNGYTLTQGNQQLLEAIGRSLQEDVGWTVPSDTTRALVTSGTSGALMLSFLALLDPGDEVIFADPYFVIYPALAAMCNAKAVPCDTYPDFRLTAARVEPLITERTKVLLVNSPGNPTGVVLTTDELRDLLELCRARGIVLISDEIYDTFTYTDAREDGRCPSPARFGEDMLLVRGFGKTYGCTGWRMGYMAGPAPLIQQVAKLQQYSFVCAPSIAQAGCAEAFGVDMSAQVAAYQRKRDIVESALGDRANIVHGGGAFYAFVEVPASHGCTATAFVERAIERNVLTIPGAVFSGRDTHFRISYATSDEQLRAGMAVLCDLL